MTTEDRSEDGSHALPDCGDAIDPMTFEQILEMDEDEDEHEFSKQIVFDFFEQAKATFDNMDQKVQEKDLADLSQLGHFLKGSSATLGLVKVKDSCEKIQHWGAGKDAGGDNPQAADACLEQIVKILPVVKADCADAERRLRAFYRED
ncbi:MAG: hypothetical protein LQ340_005041 [Diploschistes diacapsis]|nr:MAG: hypothetical protein LQ340_005041 [Diploschistes diacapsis]